MRWTATTTATAKLLMRRPPAVATITNPTPKELSNRTGFAETQSKLNAASLALQSVDHHRPH